jgi:hypothetical protein
MQKNEDIYRKQLPCDMLYVHYEEQGQSKKCQKKKKKQTQTQFLLDDLIAREKNMIPKL